MKRVIDYVSAFSMAIHVCVCVYTCMTIIIILNLREKKSSCNDKYVFTFGHLLIICMFPLFIFTVSSGTFKKKKICTNGYTIILPFFFPKQVLFFLHSSITKNNPRLTHGDVFLTVCFFCATKLGYRISSSTSHGALLYCHLKAFVFVLQMQILLSTFISAAKFQNELRQFLHV